MALLGGDEKEKPRARGIPAIGDIVLLQAGDGAPAPAVVLGGNEQDRTLDVNDLSGRFGRLNGITHKEDDSDPLVLTWTAR